MKPLKKLLCGFAISMMLLPACCSAVQAATISEEPPITIQSSDAGIVPYADQIIIYTREYDGKMQYRRWNATQNCWVDPDWIDF